MAKNQLPFHIRQLVDKKNFVIAIKTLSQEQNMSFEQAKTLIDTYEAEQVALAKKTAFNTLNQNLDNHLTQNNFKLPLIPYWVKRVAVIFLVMGILSWLMWRTFEP